MVSAVAVGLSLRPDGPPVSWQAARERAAMIRRQGGRRARAVQRLFAVADIVQRTPRIAAGAGRPHGLTRGTTAWLVFATLQALQYVVGHDDRPYRTMPIAALARLRELYGRLPEETLNPAANYFDQTDFVGLQLAAVEAGKKYIVVVVFGGLDWVTTRTAAIATTGRVAYAEGRGSGLAFQDYRGCLPVALLLIFSLLYMTFGSVSLTMLISLNVPVAATGGIFALWLRGMPFSISAGVGFIALFGIAVMNGVVLVEHIRHLRRAGEDCRTAVFQGSLDRLKPVMMTATTDALGFLPMAVSGSAGAEVQRPLATVVIGGLVTCTLLTLLVLPAIYRWFEPAAADRPVDLA
jgi:hypothetical protein